MKASTVLVVLLRGNETPDSRCEPGSRSCTQPGSSCKTWGNAAQACKGMLRMGRVDAAILAYKRSVRQKNPAFACEHSNFCDSITDWCIALVRRPAPAGLPPAPKALEGVGGACRNFRIRGTSNLYVTSGLYKVTEVHERAVTGEVPYRPVIGP